MNSPTVHTASGDKSPSRSASTEQYRPDLSRMEEIIADHDDSLKPRARIEFVVIQRLLLDLEAAGYTVTIDIRGDDPSDAFEMDGDIYAALVRIFNLDECYIGTEKAGKKSEVFLVLGNSGWDVISDYGTSLDPVITPITDWAEQFETTPVVGVYPPHDAIARAASHASNQPEDSLDLGPDDRFTHCLICESPLESHGDCSNKDCETHKGELEQAMAKAKRALTIENAEGDDWRDALQALVSAVASNADYLAEELDGAASMLTSGDSFNAEKLGESLAGLAAEIRGTR